MPYGGDSDNVEDSQGSDSDGPIIKREIGKDTNDCFLSSLEEDSSADEIDDIDKGEKSNIESSFNASNIWGIKKEESVEFKSYDLGRHFDPRISTSLDKVQALTRLANDLPVKPESKTIFEGKVPAFKNRDVSSHYIDLILKESISKKYLDWHFITENTQFEEQPPSSVLFGPDENLFKRYPTLESLLVAFGVGRDTLDFIFMEKSPLTNSRQNDTLCKLSPFDTMINAFACYQDQTEQFAKYFICFILDRKVYESMFCDTIWCSKIYKTFSADDFMQQYVSLVHSQDYFLHYRLIKLIPAAQDLLIRRLFSEGEFLAGEQARIKLVQEFNDLFDKRRFQQLLYFVLTIYGSKYMPFGDTDVTLYFKDCIADLFNASASDVELSLLNGFLSIFIKIRP